jgi:uncharacterized membrane protein
MKKYFLTGIVILLPVAITIAVIGSLVNFFTTPFVHVVATFLKDIHLADNGFLFLSHDQVVTYLSKILILICLFILIILLGMITRWIVVLSIVNLGDKLLHKIPVISSVYKTTKEIIRSIFTSDTGAFQQVVLVPFPRKDIWALGLVSGNAPRACSQSLNTALISVLIPTTPSPISGFLLMYKPEDIIYLDMKPEQAIKFIISCGAITPEHRTIS